jgi:3-oxoacyl-[acyl-carrier protein] reductase
MVPMSLTGKVALVTGAGSGIGQASALLFAREGACVVAADLDGEAAARTVAQIGDGQALALAADVSRPEDSERIVGETVARFGKLDVFFQNAGVPQAARPVEEIPLDEWQRIVAVNLTALFLGAQQAAPVMKRQRGGVILVTASIAGIRPRPGLSAYNATKGAVHLLSKTLAVELAPDKIRVCTIAPVASETPLLPTFLGQDTPEQRHKFVSTIPLGRLAQPQDIANAALYLASDESRIVTGVVLPVDSGLVTV